MSRWISSSIRHGIERGEVRASQVEAIRLLFRYARPAPWTPLVGGKEPRLLTCGSTQVPPRGGREVTWLADVTKVTLLPLLVHEQTVWHFSLMRRYSNCWKKKCINSFTKRSKLYLSCEENYKRERGIKGNGCWFSEGLVGNGSVEAYERRPVWKFMSASSQRRLISVFRKWRR